MPVTATYPGVYIEEIPSGVFSIVGVATSITAFLGRAVKGPVNQGTLITSFADYNRIFGGLADYSTMSFAVRDFFANGGTQAVIVRLFQVPGSNDGTGGTPDAAGVALIVQDLKRALNPSDDVEQIQIGDVRSFQTLARGIANSWTTSTTSVSVAGLAAQAANKVSSTGVVKDAVQQVFDNLSSQVQTKVEAVTSSFADAAKAGDDAVTVVAKDKTLQPETLMAAQALAKAVHQTIVTDPKTAFQTDLASVVDPIVNAANGVLTQIGIMTGDNAKKAAQAAANKVKNAVTKAVATRGAAEIIVAAAEATRTNPNDDSTVNLTAAQAAATNVVTLINNVNTAVTATTVKTLQQLVAAANAVVKGLRSPAPETIKTGDVLLKALSGAVSEDPDPTSAAAAQAMLGAVLTAARAVQAKLTGSTPLRDARTQAATTRAPASPAFTQAEALAATALFNVAVNTPGQNPHTIANAVLGAMNRASGDTVAKLTSDDGNLSLLAASPGTSGANLRARVESVAGSLFTLAISDGVTIERFPNLTIDGTQPNSVVDVLKAQSALVRWSGTPGAVPTADLDPRGKDPFGDDLDPDTGRRFNTKPSNADQLSDGLDLDKSLFTSVGFPALLRADLVNLVCIPPYTPEGLRTDVDSDVYDAAVQFCATKRAMLIVDPPSAWNKVSDALGPLPCARAPNAAVFFPRVNMANPLKNNRKETFVACGAIAGVFARTDAARGVWKAPAGLDASVSGIIELGVVNNGDPKRIDISDTDNGQLNPLAINCLRVFPVVGPVVWGARTLRGADQLADVDNKYIPVRRFTLFLEESLYRGTQFAVFEPNDEPLWGQLRMAIRAFMQDLFRQGAFAGKTPDEAYFVQCDDTTTTANDINLGIVNVLVGFAPLKPAEFVVIKIQQLAGQTAT